MEVGICTYIYLIDKVGKRDCIKMHEIRYVCSDCQRYERKTIRESFISEPEGMKARMREIND